MTFSTRLLSLLLTLFLSGHAWSQPVLIDTDAGQDDLMALAFLLARDPASIRGIVVTHGVAHVGPGAWNIRRLLTLAGAEHIPVYHGAKSPLECCRAFPAKWRTLADTLPGVRLPRPLGRPQTESAVDFLVRALGPKGQPHRILALGPLTTLAQVFQRAPEVRANITDIVYMGGAVDVPGNVEDRAPFVSPTKTAEWNVFADPPAARQVFESGIPILLVPLDATQRVIVDEEFAARYEAAPEQPKTRRQRLAGYMKQVLATLGASIRRGTYHAWDPLAAVALVDPGVLTIERLPLEISLDPPHEGRTHRLDSGANMVSVGVDADSDRFDRVFHGVFFGP